MLQLTRDMGVLERLQQMLYSINDGTSDKNSVGQFVGTSEGCRKYCEIELYGEHVVETECVCKDKKGLKRDAADGPREGQLQKRTTTRYLNGTPVVTLDDEGRRITPSTTTTVSSTTERVENGATSLDSPSSTSIGSEDDPVQQTIFTTTTTAPQPYLTPMVAGTASNDGTLASVSSQPSSTSVPLSNKSTTGGGLSQSSKIGLGVGLGVGLALLLAAIAFFCLARRRKRKAMDMGGAKYTPHGQSDLSMIEQSQPIQMKAEQSQATERQPLQAEYHAQQPELRHSQAYYEIPPPPAGVFGAREEQSPVTPIEPGVRGRDAAGIPLALTIPEHGRPSGVSREASPIRSHSPISPVSPVSAVSPINSRPPSPKA